MKTKIEKKNNNKKKNKMICKYFNWNDDDDADDMRYRDYLSLFLTYKLKLL